MSFIKLWQMIHDNRRRYPVTGNIGLDPKWSAYQQAVANYKRRCQYFNEPIPDTSKK